MSIRNGVWHNPVFDLPPAGERVLCVKLPKNGNKDLCFGAWYPPSDLYPEGHWTTSGSCNNVIYWMPLPGIPEESETLIMYMCDPSKNTACSKRMCFENPERKDPCRSTRDPKYAVLDENGKPIVAYERYRASPQDGGEQ